MNLMMRMEMLVMPLLLMMLTMVTAMVMIVMIRHDQTVSIRTPVIDIISSCLLNSPHIRTTINTIT